MVFSRAQFLLFQLQTLQAQTQENLKMYSLMEATIVGVWVS